MAEFVSMPETMWTVIRQAKGKDRMAVEAVFSKYRPPLLAFIRNGGFGEHDADEVLQEVFVAVLEDDVLRKADREKGRFRSFLLAVVRHVMSARRRHDSRIKRGGAASTLSLDQAAVGRFVDSRERDSSFDVEWVRNLVRLGMNQLRLECEREGTPYYRALAFLTNDEFSYAQIGERIGCTAEQVKSHIHQARVRLRRYVLKEVQAYASSREEYEDEIAYLEQFLLDGRDQS
jgi:RNA polymerase sigma-70 factor (ECF subfamily)